MKGLVVKSRHTSNVPRWRAAKSPKRSKTPESQTKIDAAALQRLVHDLQVHQIELQMQNEELRASQAAVEEARHKYADLYDFSPISYLTLDENGVILEANLTVADLLATPRKKLLKQPLSRYIAPQDMAAFASYQKRLGAGNASSVCVVHLRNNPELYVQIHTIKVESGGVVHCRTVLTDISAHKRLEGQLRQSQEQLRLILDGIKDYAVFMLDPQGTIVSWNTGAERILRYTEQEILGKPATIIFTPEDIEAGVPTQELTKAHRTGSAVDERWHIRRDGALFWASGTLNALWDEQRRLRGFVKILRDRTEEKQAEEARQALWDQLQLERARLEAVLKQMPGGVIIVEAPSGRILLRNEQVDQLLRQPPPSPTHISGYKENRGFHADGRPYEAEDWPLVRSMLKGEVVRDQDIEYLRGDGSRCILSAASAPIRDREDRIVAAVVTFTDMTDRRRAQAEMFKASKLESVGLLAGGIAHDFNNLLTAILGNIALSRMKLSVHDEAYEGLLEAEKACLRARGLTQQLLTFSKGGAPIKRTVPLGPLVKEAAEFVLHGMPVRGEFVLPDDLWLVDVDEGQIGQVISNLVINAQQAMPAGGVITITGQNVSVGEKEEPSLAPGRYVKLSVRDRGVGIGPKDLVKIFDPFYTTKASGSGLGLTTSYGIVKKHGGNITVESVPGQGTTFFVYLPASTQTGA